ncbi:DUF58 domain-containing protein [Oscillibacter sp.]|uniref:DUF58 domain-containing protein n=1 Tax=Oscillibacter sp. TaxID=1945593 RepID=UPI002896EB02|nr:DUF58 domain-containing protein [Oscillibacter sp.]
MTAARKALPAGVLLLCAVVAAIINTAAVYVPIVFILLLGLTSIFYTLLSACFLLVRAETEEQSRFERETGSLCRVTVSNRGMFVLPCVVLSLCVESTQGFAPLTTEHLMLLRPRQTLTLDLPVSFPHIGRYRVLISEVRVYGLLGVFSFRRRPGWSVLVQVTPKRFRLAGLRLGTAQPLFAVDFTAPHKIDGGEYSDVRQYAPGDPIKTIHWKLSAHASGYVTRLFQTDAVSGVSIYLDVRLPPRLTGEEAAQANDCLAESAYAAALRAMELRYGVELVYARDKVPTVIRPDGPEELLVAVCGLPPVSDRERYPLELLVEEHSGRGTSFDNLIILTAFVSDRLVALLTEYAQRGKYPVVLHVWGKGQMLPGGETGKERLAGRGIGYYAVDSAGELARVLEERL